MGFWNRLSLGTKFLILTLLGVGVMLGAFGSLALTSTRGSINQALRERLLLAESVAARLDLLLSYSTGLLEAHIERSPAGVSADATARRQLLQRVQQEMPLYSYYVAFVNRDGQVVETVPPFGELIGSRPVPLEKIRQTLEVGKPWVSGLLSGMKEEAVVYMAAPVKDRGQQTAGLVLVAIAPAKSNIGEFLPLLNMGTTGYVDIVDRNGIVLASTREERLYQMSDHQASLASLIGTGKSTVSTCHKCHTAEGGGRRGEMLAFAPLPHFPWGVAIRQEEAEVFAPARQLQKRIFFVGSLGFAVAIALSWVVVRRLVRPLQALTASSRQIARGDLDSPIPEVGDSEVKLLSQTLEVMRQKLRASFQETQQRQQELQEMVGRRDQELSALVKASASLVVELEEDALVQAVMKILVATFPYMDMGVFFLYDPAAGGLRVRSAVGYDMEPLKKVVLRPGEALAGQVFQSSQAQVCSNRAEVASALATASPTNCTLLLEARRGREPLSMVGVPLIVRSQVIGSLVLGSLRQEYAFSPEENRVISAFAAHVATILENARLFREASQAQSLREADQLKTEFLSNISHELRTPLTSIRVAIDSLLSVKDDQGEGAEVKLLRNISRNAQRLESLVAALLDMSRLQSGTVKLELRPLNLREVVLESLDTVRPLAEKKGQKVETSLPSHLAPVPGDKARLAQAVTNLLVNAVDYTPPGGDIKVTLKREGEKVTLSVADTGPGIPQAELERVFDRFYRGHLAEGKGRGGAGLGLAIARAVVELHKGRIWAESQPGRGATFYISLPQGGQS